jgi:hypothetical protein
MISRLVYCLTKATKEKKISWRPYDCSVPDFKGEGWYTCIKNTYIDFKVFEGTLISPLFNFYVDNKRYDFCDSDLPALYEAIKSVKCKKALTYKKLENYLAYKYGDEGYYDDVLEELTE